jgi:hypothetical protein
MPRPAIFTASTVYGPMPPACRWSWKARKNKFDQAP